MADTDPPPAESGSKLETLIDILIKQNADKKDESDAKKANKNKNLVKGLAKNSASIVGLTAGMTSLKSIWAKAAQDNKDIVKQLSLFGTASVKNSTALMDNLNTGYTTMAEGIETQSAIFEAGLGQMSKSSTESFVAMKALGVNIGAVANVTRFNVQAMGMSTDAAVALSESVVEAARANDQSISTLVDAIASMKDALNKTSVELGPQMTANIQAVVARMAQSNGEMAGMASSFVTSFLAGEQGFMKAARLGVMFTGQESEQQLVEKIELLSQRIVQMGLGAKGAGGGVAFQRFEDAFGLTRENFMVAEKMGRSIDTIRTDGNKAAAENLKNMDASRAAEVAMYDLQQLGVTAQQGIAKSLEPLAEFLPTLLMGLTAIEAILTVIEFNTMMGGSGGIKKFAGSAAGIGVAAGTIGLGLAMGGKDIMDIVGGEDKENSGANWGGAIGMGVGGIIGSMILPGIGTGIGMTVGNIIGGWIGGISDKDADSKADLATLSDNSSKQQKDTEEIRRIQEDQERRTRSLANPNLRILTSINDTLIRNLAVLERTAGFASRSNELAEDAKFQTGNGPPSLTTSLGAF